MRSQQLKGVSLTDGLSSKVGSVDCSNFKALKGFEVLFQLGYRRINGLRAEKLP